jgi:BirA family biotin operon repressor/biotin-[acetyl-CoA-carboxylase] ligase
MPSRFSIKWPNDIYYGNHKLAGILINSTIKANMMDVSIIGIGLNVNQSVFLSDAPNPVSLCQITGCDIDREALLCEILRQLDLSVLPDDYGSMLYRQQGFHAYSDAEGNFEAELIEVEPDGHLVLRTREGDVRRYAFKEVRFC